MSKVNIIGLSLLVVLGKAAASQSMPDASTLDREQQRIELERRSTFDSSRVFSANSSTGLPSDDDVDRERARVERERKAMFDRSNPALEHTPNTFPNLSTPPRAEIDIETIARQYEQRSEMRKMDEVMVFASFSMPRESLRKLINQANRVGASVVLRGFKNSSLKDTAKAISDLGEQTGNVIINPNAFTKYKIKAVPTVVLANAASLDQVDADGCALPDAFASVVGDVSLDYALEEIARRAPGFSQLAKRYAQQAKRP